MERDGANEVTTVVLVHGLGQDHVQLRSVVAALAPWGVTTPNAHPQSTRAEDHALPALARTLEETLDATDGEPVIGGVSMGAAVTLDLALAAKRPIAALMQIAPAVGPEGPSDAVVAYVGWLASAVERGGFHELRRQVVESELTATARDGQLAAVDDWERRFSPEVLLAAWRGFLASTKPVDVDALGSLALPVLVVGWDDDPLHPLATAGLYADAIPRAELVVVDPPTDGQLPGEIGSIIGRFLGGFTSR